MSTKDLTIIITTFKSEDKIRNCLNSINKDYKVINVENSNNLIYKEKIEKEFKNVECILSKENAGYGKANNIGITKVKTKYALILNPDTLWTEKYSEEIQTLEKTYFKEKTPCLLLVNKELSIDKSFKGDFNLKNKIISKDEKNQYIYTGLQIISRDNLDFISKEVFSMNEVWNNLIDKKNLYGIESNQKFYHLNSMKMYEKISSLSSID